MGMEKPLKTMVNDSKKTQNIPKFENSGTMDCKLSLKNAKVSPFLEKNALVFSNVFLVN